MPIEGRAEPGRLLCLICALRWYLGWTESNPIHLFLPITDRVSGSTPAMVSAWICGTILRVYTLDPGNAGSATARVPAHDVRAFAASGRAFTRVPMGEVVRAAS